MSMNKIVSFVFVLLLSLQLFAQQVHEEVISTGDTLIFSCSADTATLTCTGLIRSSDVVIPSVVEHDGQQYTVTALGVCCFNHAVAMSHLTIPNTVRTIKLAALGGLMKIGTVKIPDSVRYIAELAFGDVPNVEYHGNASGAPWGAWYINAYKERSYSDRVIVHDVREEVPFLRDGHWHFALMTAGFCLLMRWLYVKYHNRCKTVKSI